MTSFSNKSIIEDVKKRHELPPFLQQQQPFHEKLDYVLEMRNKRTSVIQLGRDGNTGEPASLVEPVEIISDDSDDDVTEDERHQPIKKLNHSKTASTHNTPFKSGLNTSTEGKSIQKNDTKVRLTSYEKQGNKLELESQEEDDVTISVEDANHPATSQLSSLLSNRFQVRTGVSYEPLQSKSQSKLQELPRSSQSSHSAHPTTFPSPLTIAHDKSSSHPHSTPDTSARREPISKYEFASQGSYEDKLNHVLERRRQRFGLRSDKIQNDTMKPIVKSQFEANSHEIPKKITAKSEETPIHFEIEDDDEAALHDEMSHDKLLSPPQTQPQVHTQSNTPNQNSNQSQIQSITQISQPSNSMSSMKSHYINESLTPQRQKTIKDDKAVEVQANTETVSVAYQVSPQTNTVEIQAHHEKVEQVDTSNVHTNIEAEHEILEETSNSKPTISSPLMQSKGKESIFMRLEREYDMEKFEEPSPITHRKECKIEPHFQSLSDLNINESKEDSLQNNLPLDIPDEQDVENSITLFLKRLTPTKKSRNTSSFNHSRGYRSSFGTDGRATHFNSPLHERRSFFEAHDEKRATTPIHSKSPYAHSPSRLTPQQYSNTSTNRSLSYRSRGMGLVFDLGSDPILKPSSHGDIPQFFSKKQSQPSRKLLEDSPYSTKQHSSVSQWDFTPSRFQKYRAASLLSRESLEILRERRSSYRKSYDFRSDPTSPKSPFNRNFNSSAEDIDTEIPMSPESMSFSSPLSNRQNFTSLFSIPKAKSSRSLSDKSEVVEVTSRIKSNKSLLQFWEKEFLIEEGDSTRAAVKFVLDGDFEKCLRQTDDIPSSLVKNKQDNMEFIEKGAPFYKNSHNGKMNVRFFHFSEKHKTLCWGKGETKKTKDTRPSSSRTIPISNIQSIRLFEVPFADVQKLFKLKIKADLQKVCVILVNTSKKSVGRLELLTSDLSKGRQFVVALAQLCAEINDSK